MDRALGYEGGQQFLPHALAPGLRVANGPSRPPADLDNPSGPSFPTEVRKQLNKRASEGLRDVLQLYPKEVELREYDFLSDKRFNNLMKVLRHDLGCDFSSDELLGVVQSKVRKVEGKIHEAANQLLLDHQLFDQRVARWTRQYQSAYELHRELAQNLRDASLDQIMSELASVLREKLKEQAFIESYKANLISFEKIYSEYLKFDYVAISIPKEVCQKTESFIKSLTYYRSKLDGVHLALAQRLACQLKLLKEHLNRSGLNHAFEHIRSRPELAKLIGQRTELGWLEQFKLSTNDQGQFRAYENALKNCRKDASKFQVESVLENFKSTQQGQ